MILFAWTVFNLRVHLNGGVSYQCFPSFDLDFRWNEFHQIVKRIRVNDVEHTIDVEAERKRAALEAARQLDSMFIVLSERVPQIHHREHSVDYDFFVYECYENGRCKLRHAGPLPTL